MVAFDGAPPQSLTDVDEDEQEEQEVAKKVHSKKVKALTSRGDRGFGSSGFQD